MTQRPDSIRVLHVEDEPEFADLAATWLERAEERIAVRSAETPEEALEVLERIEVDCVVSDYEMPGLDGIEFLEAVREEWPDLPFVLFTGKGSEEVASDAISAGVSDYLQKERGTDQYAVLANRITNLVEQHRVERELRRSERELAETTRKLEAVFAASPVPIVTVDTDGAVELWNDAASSLFGWTEDEVVGEPLPGVPPDEREAFCDLRERVLDGESVTDVRVQYHTKGGEELSLLLSAAPIRDADGGVDGVMTVMTRVGERERTLEQLHEVTRDLLRAESKEAIARRTVEAVRDELGYPNNLVRFVDADDDALHPVAATSGAEELVGDRPVYPVGEGTAGRAFASGETIVHEDVRELDDGYDRKNARASMYVPIGDHGTLSIGDTEPGAFDRSDVHVAEIFAANAEAALDRVEETVARRRENDRLEEFAWTISHDLRNPLNVLQTALDLAEETGDPEQFERGRRAIERMDELIEDVLALARDGTDAVTPTPVALDEVAEAAWRTVETADAELRTETDATLIADESRLRQLFANLFRNAVEHGSTSPGSQARQDAVDHGSTSPDSQARRDAVERVAANAESATREDAVRTASSKVTVTVRDCDGGFAVEDDGPGVPPEERDRIFESGYGTGEEGTGLGLRIVRQIADAHGWDVSVTDAEAEAEADAGGARFEFTGVREC